MAESRRLWCHRRVWLKCSKAVARELQVLPVRACRWFNRATKTTRQAQAPSPVFFIEAPGRPVFLLPSGCEGMARQGALPSSVQDPHLLAEMRKRLPARHPNMFNVRAHLRPSSSASPTVVNGMPAPGRAFRAAVLIGGFPRSEAAASTHRVCRHFWRPLRQETAGKPQRLHRQPAPGGRPVLATRRSPGAARVRGRSVRLPPAGAASGSIIRRLMMTPLDRAGRNVTTIL